MIHHTSLSIGTRTIGDAAQDLRELKAMAILSHLRVAVLVTNGFEEIERLDPH